MKTDLSLLLCVALVLLPACVHRAVRTGPSVWQLRGAVVLVSDTTLRVRHKSGQLVDLQLDDHTVYIRHERADSRQSLRRGALVTIDVETLQGGGYRARLVRIV